MVEFLLVLGIGIFFDKEFFLIYIVTWVDTDFFDVFDGFECGFG